MGSLDVWHRVENTTVYKQTGVVAIGSGIMVRYGLGEPVRIYAGNVPRWALKHAQKSNATHSKVLSAL